MSWEARRARLQLALMKKELERRLVREAEKLQSVEDECKSLHSQLDQVNIVVEERLCQIEQMEKERSWTSSEQEKPLELKWR